MVKIIRYILFPLAIIYGLITAFRNLLYDKQILKSSKFDVKTIQVGNLSVGGTGKTPHIEYLTRLLQDSYKLATLSRGYGRKKTGYLQADENSTAEDIGDEPLQFYQKFKDISVHVDAKRVNGVIQIMSAENPPEVILMDDAFQHRAVKAGFSILLTDYAKPYYSDCMLPTGDLREFPNGKKRAQVILVTKCPGEISYEEQTKIISKLKPQVYQTVYFSKIKYGGIKPIHNLPEINLDTFEKVVLVTGIANPKPLISYLNTKQKEINHLRFPDHHPYSIKNIQHIITTFETEKESKKIILTTEKDAMRLKDFEELKELPLYFIEIEIEIFPNKDKFNKQIVDYVT